MKEELYNFLNNPDFVKAEFYFENAEALWMGITGLKVPIRIGQYKMKIDFQKSFLIDDVLTIRIYPGERPEVKFVMKCSMMIKTLKENPFGKQLIFNDNDINILDSDNAHSPNLTIDQNSIDILFLINEKNYFISLKNFKTADYQNSI